MIKELIHDSIFLRAKSETAAEDDLQFAQDLLNMLVANKDGFVYMAANIIGMHKRLLF